MVRRLLLLLLQLLLFAGVGDAATISTTLTNSSVTSYTLTPTFGNLYEFWIVAPGATSYTLTASWKYSLYDQFYVEKCTAVGTCSSRLFQQNGAATPSTGSTSLTSTQLNGPVVHIFYEYDDYATAGAYLTFSYTAILPPCAAGSYGPGGPSCTVCPAGSYSLAGATTVCTSCPAGTASATVGASSAATCVTCAAGTFAASAGSAQCTTCAKGSFAPVAGATGCTTCATVTAGS